MLSFEDYIILEECDEKTANSKDKIKEVQECSRSSDIQAQDKSEKRMGSTTSRCEGLAI
jgi:hypothetical protein